MPDRIAFAAVAFAVGLFAPLLFVCRAAAVTSAEAVGSLNEQRQSNGLPAGIVERPGWSQACAKHDAYEQATGEFGHSENPSSPFYSEEGDWAARNSVLAWGALNWADGNPWEDAPIHLVQMLAPALAEMGADESHDHSCATTWPGYSRPAPESLTAYSYPGDGVNGVIPGERAEESPFVPGDFVGLPAGSETGRYLLAYLAGAEVEYLARVSTASLNGPDGPVELKVVDSTDPNVGSYMPHPSAFLIPAQPLQSNAHYEAVVVWEGEAPLIEQRFGFTTGSTEPATVPVAETVVRHPSSPHSRCSVLARRAARQRHRARRLARSTRRLARRRGSRKAIARHRRRARGLSRRARRTQALAHHCRLKRSG